MIVDYGIVKNDWEVYGTVFRKNTVIKIWNTWYSCSVQPFFADNDSFWYLINRDDRKNILDIDRKFLEGIDPLNPPIIFSNICSN
jgi:triacylglycerol esterase/lipase EstA (alpha/beta hydrolase family)